MKQTGSVLLSIVMPLFFSGVVFAGAMSGEVAAVDYAKGQMILKSATAAVGFDCEEGSLIKEVKVGDKVTVQYNEEGGRHIATKVSLTKKKASAGC